MPGHCGMRWWYWLVGWLGRPPDIGGVPPKPTFRCCCIASSTGGRTHCERATDGGGRKFGHELHFCNVYPLCESIALKLVTTTPASQAVPSTEYLICLWLRGAFFGAFSSAFFPCCATLPLQALASDNQFGPPPDIMPPQNFLDNLTRLRNTCAPSFSVKTDQHALLFELHTGCRRALPVGTQRSGALARADVLARAIRERRRRAVRRGEVPELDRLLLRRRLRFAWETLGRCTGRYWVSI